MTLRRWEYKLISTDDVPGGSLLGVKDRGAVETYLNQLGSEGWEIVGINFMQLPTFFNALARRER